MWRLAGRTAAVFLFWGVLMVLAISGGMPAFVAELLACCGAGGTLTIWGSLIRRQERQLAAATAHALADDAHRERATP